MLFDIRRIITSTISPLKKHIERLVSCGGERKGGCREVVYLYSGLRLESLNGGWGRDEENGLLADGGGHKGEI